MYKNLHLIRLDTGKVPRSCMVTWEPTPSLTVYTELGYIKCRISQDYYRNIRIVEYFVNGIY